MTPAPLELHRSVVLPEWIDYNDHLNVGYYSVAFDQATDALLDHLGVGADYRRRTNLSVFVVEAHLVLRREVKLGDPLRFTSQLIAGDEKRLHFFHQMFHGGEGYLAATNELLIVHVDLDGPRATPFPAPERARIEACLAVHRDLPVPKEVGRRMGIAGRG